MQTGFWLWRCCSAVLFCIAVLHCCSGCFFRAKHLQPGRHHPPRTFLKPKEARQDHLSSFHSLDLQSPKRCCLITEALSRCSSTSHWLWKNPSPQCSIRVGETSIRGLSPTQKRRKLQSSRKRLVIRYGKHCVGQSLNPVNERKLNR